jgi:hypothetical protein
LKERKRIHRNSVSSRDVSKTIQDRGNETVENECTFALCTRREEAPDRIKACWNNAKETIDMLGPDDLFLME